MGTKECAGICFWGVFLKIFSWIFDVFFSQEMSRPFLVFKVSYVHKKVLPTRFVAYPTSDIRLGLVDV